MLNLGVISKGAAESWRGFLVTKLLGSLGRSGLQLCLVFDADVYFLKVVVGVVLPSRRDDLQTSLDQLQRFFFRLRVDKYVIKER